MTSKLLAFFLAFCVVFLFNASKSIAADEVSESSLNYKAFGEFKLYRPPQPTKNLVLFFSGEQGWTSNLAEMAKEIAGQGAAVAGLSLPKYISYLKASKAKCAYPSGDLENLSKFVQNELKFTDYELPILIGSGNGAGFAYGSFFQAPENTFMATIGLDFCPSYRSTKVICNGEGMKSNVLQESVDILPTERKLAGWTTIHSESNSTCKSEAAEKFTSQVKEAKFINAKGDGRAELRQKISEILKLVPAQNLHAGAVESLKDLPLIILEPPNFKRGSDDYFVIFYSGDGGWAGFDKVISAEFNARGVPVVGLSTLSYFWKAKTPEASAEDLRKILQHFHQKWAQKYGLKRVVLLGYSFGADVLPFLAVRLPSELQKLIASLSMLSSSGFGAFEFHLSDWLSSSSSGPSIIPELEKLMKQTQNKVQVQCIYGSDEKKPFCEKIDPKMYSIIKLPGGHRFDGDTPKLVNLIHNGTKPPSPASP